MKENSWDLKGYLDTLRALAPDELKVVEREVSNLFAAAEISCGR